MRNFILCRDIDEVIEFWKDWDKKRDKAPYWIDGIVVKVSERRFQDALAIPARLRVTPSPLSFLPRKLPR